MSSMDRILARAGAVIVFLSAGFSRYVIFFATEHEIFSRPEFAPDPALAVIGLGIFLFGMAGLGREAAVPVAPAAVVGPSDADVFRTPSSHEAEMKSAAEPPISSDMPSGTRSRPVAGEPPS